MRLCEPFEGYKLLCGHPIYHITFVIGSYYMHYLEHYVQKDYDFEQDLQG